MNRYRLDWNVVSGLLCLLFLVTSVSGDNQMKIQQIRMSYSPDIYSTELENGLQVYVLPDHRVPLTHIGFAVRTGAVSETKESNGLAHLYEHMFFKANEQYPSKEAFENREKELGIVSNASTSAEVVRYHFSLPSDRLEEGVDFMASAMLQPLFQKDELEKERNVVLDEYDRAMSKPDRRFHRGVREQFFHQYPWRRDALGSREVVAGATRKQMQHFKENYYRPNNTAFIVIGDVNPKRVMKLADRELSDWPPGEVPGYDDLPSHPSLEESKAIIETGDVDYAKMQVRWSGPKVREEPHQTYAADVWGMMLDLSSSKFRTNLVDEGPFQSISFSYYTQQDGPTITFQGTISPDQFQDGYKLFQQQLGQFPEPGYFTEQDLDHAIRNLKVDRKFSVENGRSYLQTLGFWWAVAGLDYYKNYLENMSQVSLSDVRNFTERYLIGEPHVVGALFAPDVHKQNHVDQDWLLKHWSVSKETEQRASVEETGSTASEASEEASEKQVRSSKKKKKQEARGEEAVPNGTYQFQLQKDIPVILRKTDANQIVSLKLFFNGGTPTYGEFPAGIEQFLLRTMLRGSEAFPLEKLQTFLDKKGISFSSSANYDYSSFSMRFLSDRLSDALRVLKDVVNKPLLKQEQVEWVRRQMISSIRKRKTDPNSEMWFVANELMFQNHPYRKFPGGRIEDLQEIDQQLLESYYEELIRSGNILLSVVGNVSIPKLKHTLNRLVESVPESSRRNISVPSFDLEAGSQLKREPIEQSRTVYIVAKFPLPSLRSSIYPVMELGLKILSERIFDELRNKRGLTYGAYAGQAFYRRNWGYFYVTTPKPNKAVSLIRKEIQDMKTELVSTQEQEQAVNLLRTRKLLDRQSSGVQAKELGRMELIGSGWETEGDLLEQLQDVSREEIRAAFREHVNHFQYGVMHDSNQEDVEIRKPTFLSSEQVGQKSRD